MTTRRVHRAPQDPLAVVRMLEQWIAHLKKGSWQSQPWTVAEIRAYQRVLRLLLRRT